MNCADPPPFSVLIVDSRLVRSDRLASSVGACGSLRFLGCARNLTQAYTLTETHRPNVVVISGDKLGLPEFPMYAAMIGILRITMLILDAEDGPPPPQFLADRVIAADDLDRAGGLGPYLERRFGLVKAAEDRPLPGVGDIGSTGRTQWKTVVIGSSTGGIEALAEILSRYPADCPPTLIVQHIRGGFVPGLADRLNRECAAEVAVAAQMDRITPGKVLLAPDNSQHLRLVAPGQRCRLEQGEPVSGHRPSVDALFLSAVPMAPDIVAVLLTGMGDDGARGMAAIRRAGGWTIGQDAATSTVYGMPRAARELGGVEEELPIQKIGPALLSAAGRQEETSQYATP